MRNVRVEGVEMAGKKLRYEAERVFKNAKKKGRGGDTDIVHVNEREKRLLKSLGGAGTVNPETGLKEYYSGHPGKIGGEQAAKNSNMGGGVSGGGNGGNQGGMSPALLDSKYPGAKGKKNRQYEASLKNLAKVGTIVGGVIGGPVGTAVSMGSSALDAINGELDPLDPFDNRMADVPSVGAGNVDSQKKADAVTGLTADRKKKRPKPSSPLGSVGTILSGVGGSIRAGGL